MNVACKHSKGSNKSCIGKFLVQNIHPPRIEMSHYFPMRPLESLVTSDSPGELLLVTYFHSNSVV